MKLAIIISVLSHSFLFSQVSITDINRIGNQQLEEIKKELQNQPEENLNFNNVEDIESTAVIIEQEETELVNEGYYGYNYFKSEINFFDNVPTPSEFKLGAGDEIVISLWGDTNLREQFKEELEG